MINFIRKYIQETKFFHRQSEYFVLKSWNKFWKNKIKKIYYITLYPFHYFKYMWSTMSEDNQ